MNIAKDENNRPVTHFAPDSFFTKILFYIRLIFDFQTISIYRHLKKYSANYNGKVLDIGCGNSPFEFLINKNTCQYTGLDVEHSNSFGYQRENVVYYDGQNFPFENQIFNHFICTEVLEHVSHPELFIEEILRITSTMSSGILTIPWSARYHYIPYDYHRYTPSMLELLFRNFSSATIIPRGTDITSICAKIINIFFRTLRSFTKVSLLAILLFPIKLVLFVALLPLLFCSIIVGHLSLLFNIGSNDDPMGYTIILQKK